jgi:hypothetical protein
VRSNPRYQHPDLLAKALALPVAKLYLPLWSQSFTSICGPTSVANVLRSMSVATRKNPFRPFGLRPMSLDQLVSESGEVMPAGWQARAVRPRTLEDLRAELRASNDESRRYVSNFDRRSLFGAGGGHHSPLGGFLEDEDLVLVLDVNARFGPWLVEPNRLLAAMTNPSRGLARFERQ